jgi:hypothetical protein
MSNPTDAALISILELVKDHAKNLDRREDWVTALDALLQQLKTQA